MTKGKNHNPESVVREIRRKTRKKYSSEEKIRIVLEGLKGEESIAAICRREGIVPNLYYRWSKDLGKKRLQSEPVNSPNKRKHQTITCIFSNDLWNIECLVFSLIFCCLG